MNNNKNQYRQENKEEIGKTSNVSTKDERITTVMKRKQKNKWENAKKLVCDDDIHRGWNDAHFHSRLCVKYLELLKISLKVCFIKVGGKLSHHYFQYKFVYISETAGLWLFVLTVWGSSFVCSTQTNSGKKICEWNFCTHSLSTDLFVCNLCIHPLPPTIQHPKLKAAYFFSEDGR